jgi:DNA invertase Pin-like site-specific DNA recombinase
MSTEHQQYSTENQAAVIRRYAEAHAMEITKTYSDDGKSGLSVTGRGALKQMIQDVENGTAGYEAILVYDVSRWGRFQDADESAYYEYLCKRAKIEVHYCAELFPNDGSHSSALLKTIKRTMAGEYSRELSVKVFAGQCRLIELGFRQGGMPGYGLRRQLIDQNRTPKAVLAPGERKSLQTDRVILVPGPTEEVTVVREMYQRFLNGETEQAIADELNRRGVLSDLGREWTGATVRQILTNPKYIGANVYNRRSFKLKRKRVENPPDMWIHRDEAFDAIVEPEVFRRVQDVMTGRHSRLSDEQMLTLLRQLLAQKGSLSGVLIDEAEGMPSSSAYRSRFKSLHRAYGLIGYTPERDLSFIEVNRALRARHRAEMAEIIDQLSAVDATVRADPRTGLLTVNDEFTVSVVLGRCCEIRKGVYRWLLRLDASLAPDVTIAARLGPGNAAILDYYLFPAIDALAERLRLAQDNSFVLDVYRFDSLSCFLELARRRTIEEAA